MWVHICTIWMHMLRSFTLQEQGYLTGVTDWFTCVFIRCPADQGLSCGIQTWKRKDNEVTDFVLSSSRVNVGSCPWLEWKNVYLSLRVSVEKQGLQDQVPACLLRELTLAFSQQESCLFSSICLQVLSGAALKISSPSEQSWSPRIGWKAPWALCCLHAGWCLQHKVTCHWPHHPGLPSP